MIIQTHQGPVNTQEFRQYPVSQKQEENQDFTVNYHLAAHLLCAGRTPLHPRVVAFTKLTSVSSLVQQKTYFVRIMRH